MPKPNQDETLTIEKLQELNPKNDEVVSEFAKILDATPISEHTHPLVAQAILNTAERIDEHRLESQKKAKLTANIKNSLITFSYVADLASITVAGNFTMGSLANLTGSAAHTFISPLNSIILMGTGVTAAIVSCGLGLTVCPVIDRAIEKRFDNLKSSKSPFIQKLLANDKTALGTDILGEALVTILQNHSKDPRDFEDAKASTLAKLNLLAHVAEGIAPIPEEQPEIAAGEISKEALKAHYSRPKENSNQNIARGR